MGTESEESDNLSVSKLQLLLMLGFIITFVGVAILIAVTFTQGFSGSASSGGIVLIGPFPIVFGSGPQAPWLILLTSALTVITLVAFIILNRKAGRRSD